MSKHELCCCVYIKHPQKYIDQTHLYRLLSATPIAHIHGRIRLLARRPAMSFFQIKWLRKLVRRNTKPIEYTHALAWRDRLSIGYALLAWNAFGMVCYMVYTGRNDWAKFHGLKTAEDELLSPGECTTVPVRLIYD